MKRVHTTPGRSHSDGHRGRSSKKTVKYGSIKRPPVSMSVNVQSENLLRIRGKRRAGRPRLRTIEEIRERFAQYKAEALRQAALEKQRRDEERQRKAEKAKRLKDDYGYGYNRSRDCWALGGSW